MLDEAICQSSRALPRRLALTPPRLSSRGRECFNQQSPILRGVIEAKSSRSESLEKH